MSVPKMTAADIRAALRAQFDTQSHAIAFEVANEPGAGAHRHLDAVVMGLWPSQGLYLHGIEVKVTRSDFLRELKQPMKAEAVACRLDFFSIAAPEGMIAPDELPLNWGLMEVGAAGKFSIRKKAIWTPAKDVDRQFLAVMLRAAKRAIDGESLKAIISRERERIYEQFSEEVDRRVKRVTAENSDKAQKWDALMEALKDSQPDVWINDTQVLGAVRVVLAAGVVGAYNRADELRKSLEMAHERLGAALDHFRQTGDA